MADTLTANANLVAERLPAAVATARVQGANRARPALAMVAPAFMLMCLLLLGPLAGVIALSFTDYQLGSPTFSWIGLENYREMLADRVFWTLAPKYADLCGDRGACRRWRSGSASRC